MAKFAHSLSKSVEPGPGFAVCRISHERGYEIAQFLPESRQRWVTAQQRQPFVLGAAVKHPEHVIEDVQRRLAANEGLLLVWLYLDTVAVVAGVAGSIANLAQVPGKAAAPGCEMTSPSRINVWLVIAIAVAPAA